MRIAISGMGAATPLGVDIATTWANVERGQTAIGLIAHFAGTPLETRLGGSMARREPPRRRGDAALEFAVRAAREAMARHDVVARRTAVVLGTTMAPRDRPVADLAAELRDALQLEGALVVVVSTACTSGSAAVATGANLLAMGAADVVLAGGTDELDLKSFAGFHALHLLAAAPCAPFGQHLGTSLGEGAAFFVLEREADAIAFARSPLAFLEGTGSSSDGYHATTPHPTGDGLARAALAALAQAGVAADDVDWVSAHGTGTAANDATESLAISRVFADRGATVPVTASKSMVGHTLGAAGAIELAIAIAGLQRHRIPPTVGVTQQRPSCGVNLVTELCEHPSKRVLKLGAAFGGANAALVVARVDASPGAAPKRSRREVRLAGSGAAGAPRAELDPMGIALDFRGRMDASGFDALAPGVDPRGLDPTSRLLILAAQRALRRAGLELAGEAANRAGLFVGQRRASPSSTDEFEASIETRGLLAASGSAFTRRVLNTPSGAASRSLALRGPTLTLSTGRGSGLFAVALAAEQLASQDDADVLVAGGVDELAEGEDPRACGDGAAFVALDASMRQSIRRDTVVAGWAVGGPRDRARVVAMATELAGVDRFATLHTFEPRADDLGVPAVGGVLALGRAEAAIGDGSATWALVVEEGALATTAILLTVGAKRGDHAS